MSLCPTYIIWIATFSLGRCKGTLFPNSFSNRISLPYDSRHIPSMQSLVCPTTLPVNHLLLKPTLFIFLSINSITETQKHTLNISMPYSIVCHSAISWLSPSLQLPLQKRPCDTQLGYTIECQLAP